MAICPADFNSCTEKCKLTYGPNAGVAYDCANPCACYPTYIDGARYTFQNGDCVAPSGCGNFPNGTNNCTGTLYIKVGADLRGDATGPAAKTPAVNNDYNDVAALVGTSNDVPAFNWTLTVTANNGKFPPRVGWFWILAGVRFSPSIVYDTTTVVASNPGSFGGTFFNSVQWYLQTADGAVSTNEFSYRQYIGNAECIAPCCGCTPCSPGGSGCPACNPDCDVNLFGRLKVSIIRYIVIYKWSSSGIWQTSSTYVDPNI